jgi:hypothetical protein
MEGGANMRLTRVKLRVSVPHPAVANDSAFCHARDLFEGPEFQLETVGNFVRITSEGKSRLVNLNQVLWCDEAVEPAPQQEKQKQGGKRG